MPLRVGVTTPLSAWKEEGADAWSSAAGRQLVEDIEDRTDTCESREYEEVCCYAGDGRRDTCTPASYPVVLAAPNGSAARGDWRTMVARKWQLDARGPGAGPLPLSNSH